MALELVHYIVQNLVAEPSELKIDMRQDGMVTHIDIRCASDDAGRIIGRGGRIINSIRTLARAAADGRERIEVNLIDR